jgi:small-conductance mechanosensitive channel
MKPMLFPKISLLLNILVLIPVCSGLLLKANWSVDSYGIDTPARGILLSIYLAILIFSAVLLFNFDPKMVLALLSVQIIYKLISPIMVGTMTNPVIISNIFIALFHAYSVWKIIELEKSAG